MAFTGGDVTALESGVTEHTYTYSISDPGTDDVDHVTVSCGTGGTLSGTPTNTNTSGSFNCKFLDGPASPTVTVNATDSDLETGNTATRPVAVANVAPMVAFTGGDVTALESGVAEHTYTYSISDPGTDDIDHVTVSCGTGGTLSGTPTNTNTSGSFNCKFLDGPASPTVTVNATDSDLETGNTANRPVAVANVAPTATLSNGGPVNEGSPVSVSFSAQFDPSPTDTSAGLRYAFSCSNGDLSRRHLRLGQHRRLDELHLPRRPGDQYGQGQDHRQGRRLHRVHDRTLRSTTSPRRWPSPAAT